MKHWIPLLSYQASGVHKEMRKRIEYDEATKKPDYEPNVHLKYLEFISNLIWCVEETLFHDPETGSPYETIDDMQGQDT